jgi:hypothetical protein
MQLYPSGTVSFLTSSFLLPINDVAGAQQESDFCHCVPGNKPKINNGQKEEKREKNIHGILLQGRPFPSCKARDHTMIRKGRVGG